MPKFSGIWGSINFLVLSGAVPFNIHALAFSPYNIYTALNLSPLMASERYPRNYCHSCYFPSGTDILLIFLWRLSCELYHIFHSDLQSRICSEYSLCLSSPLGTFSNILQHLDPRTEFSPCEPLLYPLTGCYGNSEAHIATPYSINQLVLGLLTWKMFQRVVWVLEWGLVVGFFWLKNKKRM